MIKRMAVKNPARRKAPGGASQRVAKLGLKAATTTPHVRGQPEPEGSDNEARLRAILDTAVDGIITIDERGTIESFNQSAEKLFGYAADTVIGRNISLLMPSPHREAHDHYLANYRQSGERKIIGIGREVSGLRSDGSTFPLELSVSETQLEGRRIFTGIVRDITRRTAAEEALRQERDFSAAVLETAGALVIVLDSTGRVVQLNRACRDLTGFASNEICGQPVWERLLPPEKVAEVKAVFEQLVVSRVPSHYENHFITKNGQRCLIEWANTVLTNPDGSIRNIIGTGLDITERRRGEIRQRLQLSVTRLLAESHSLSEAVPKLLEAVANELECDVGEFWNLDKAKKQLRVLHIWHLPSEELAAFVEHSCALHLGMFDGLPGRVLKSGQPDWIPDVLRCSHFAQKRAAKRAGLKSALAFPVALGRRVLGVMAFLGHQAREPDTELFQLFASLGSQIGQFMERKRAEEALQWSETNLAQAQQLARLGGYEINLSGTGGDHWSEEVYRILGLNPANRELTSTEYISHCVHPEDQARVREALAKAGRECVGLDVAYRIVRPDGSLRHVQNIVEPVPGGDKKVFRLVGTLQDITERKELEEEILNISEREKRSIGHDLHDGLGQQLTALEMKCFLLLDDLAAGDPAARREQLQEQVRHMSQALRECIKVTRSLAHGLAPVNLEADGLAGALRQLAHHTSVPGKIDCRFTCRAIVTLQNSQTANHLYRIAQEAVNNALKHAQSRQIRITLTHDRGVLRLQIQDDGRGLPKVRKSKTGMGLEVMRHRAHVIGASLATDSKPGQGVTITCTLPLEIYEH